MCDERAYHHKCPARRDLRKAYGKHRLVVHLDHSTRNSAASSGYFRLLNKRQAKIAPELANMLPQIYNVVISLNGDMLWHRSSGSNHCDLT
jgi:hypothetical protein